MPETGKKQNRHPRVSVVIPAFNEEATIAEVVQAIRAVDNSYEVIVVDDGSADRTADEAGAAGARVIRNPYNIGNGASDLISAPRRLSAAFSPSQMRASINATKRRQVVLPEPGSPISAAWG